MHKHLAESAGVTSQQRKKLDTLFGDLRRAFQKGSGGRGESTADASNKLLDKVYVMFIDCG
eukprot:912687-Pyramimonas_sp.AAC.1